MAIENAGLVEAYHQATGEKREVPENYLGAHSPFPGQWAKSPPAEPQAAPAPAKNAKHEAWVAYAVSQGATESDVVGKTRDELAETYSQES